MNLVFETDRLYIEKYEKKHINSVFDFYKRNREMLKEYEPFRSEEFYTLKWHKKQFLYDKKDMKQLRFLSFLMFKKEDRNRIVGIINLNDISYGVFESCRIGYKTDKDEQNKGYMKEALGKLIKVIFNELGLHRIEANVMPSNTASIKLLESLGFIEEGYSRNYLKINGKWRDHKNYALLDES